ncbi:hypothetical protein SAMN05443999_101336 [Roseovarius azorensis]|uniref:Type IV pilus biogenesis protein PilP n=1 Tax=Roseovarius azorensis TaxID=1287727 RepID=A0A1H7GLC8_9RHOB|nr:hypothetical protein [Roseovarius azorensis]SEK38966.1 hypothetical protein SAMN05443999_101336 [Roseovarius azorensis]
MKPNFALSLSFEGIGLLHRAGSAGWHLVGEVALDATDLAGDLASLRNKAAALDPAGLASKLIIPEEQIRYLDLVAGDASAGDIATLVADALDGATPYALDELAYDWVQTGAHVQVAAVARETLQEAESFAREHRFNPVSFVARPAPERFAGEPFFGPATGAQGVERDTGPVRIIDRAPPPPAKPASEPAVIAAAAPDQAKAQAEPAPKETQHSPLPSFSSIRAERGASPSESAPRLAGAARFTPLTSDIRTPDLPRPGGNPILTGAADPALTDLAIASLAPDPVTDRGASRKPAPPRMRGTEPAGPARPAAATTAVSPADEAQRLTIFGAREAPGARGRPRFLGLILTAILLLFLVGVAAWAAIFTDSGLARLFRAPEPQIAITPDLPDPVRPVTEPALPDVAPPAPDAVPASEPEPEPRELTPDEALARYAATGIWQIAPAPPEVPDLTSLDEFYQTSIDEAVQFQDALALPPARDMRMDARPETPASPAPAGTVFAFDERGLVQATPEGALTPDGVRVQAGPPPVTPPQMPVRAVSLPSTEQTVETLAEVQRIGAVRPRTRPDDLIEQGERGALAGRTRSELAALRPRPRPASVIAAAQAVETDADAVAAALAEAVAAPATSATPQAVAASLKPRVRPGNLARAVQRSVAVAPDDPIEDDEPEVVATARSAPNIPSTASVARAATDSNAINLRNVNLIGVYGTPGNRRALIRLANGRYEKVKVGDRIDGGQVLAIGDSELHYKKRGRDVVLRMPKG